MKTIITILLLGLLSGCGLLRGGTGTGNPALPASPASAPLSTDSAALGILDSACEALARCHAEISKIECVSALENTSHLIQAIGAGSGGFSSLQDLAQAEISGSLSPDTNSIFQCKTELSNVSCSDPAMVNAYIQTNSDAYQDFDLMVPSGNGTCSTVF